MTEDKQKALCNRLNRAEGQIRALKRMLQDEKTIDCKAFISQVKAARSALKGLSEQYVLEYIDHCQQLPEAKRKEHIAEAVKILTSD